MPPKSDFRRLAGRAGGGDEVAAMKCPMDQKAVSVKTITATIASSAIVVVPPVTRLPAGFEEVDLAILNWLAAEAARMRSRFALMQ